MDALKAYAVIVTGCLVFAVILACTKSIECERLLESNRVLQGRLLEWESCAKRGLNSLFYQKAK